MPYIKLIVMDSHNCGGDYDNTEYRLGADITDWEEVTDEDLAFLKKYKYQLWAEMRAEQPNRWDYHSSLLIVELDGAPLKERLTNLKAKLADQIAKEKVAAKKRAELAEVRKEQRRIQKLAQEHKTLETLAKKHGVEIALPTPSGS